PALPAERPSVMAGLGPAIHDFFPCARMKTHMPGSGPFLSRSDISRTQRGAPALPAERLSVMAGLGPAIHDFSRAPG
ncbi:hypothetical protein, partial [Ancylobacter oerskovii]|uniref:hypothetical protein n=1 Tax=Ancylobacter oerskovii TaxID=459519 RepID=UPI001BCBBDE5